MCIRKLYITYICNTLAQKKLLLVEVGIYYVVLSLMYDCVLFNFYVYIKYFQRIIYFNNPFPSIVFIVLARQREITASVKIIITRTYIIHLHTNMILRHIK